MVFPSIPSALSDHGHDFDAEIRVCLREIGVGIDVAQHDLITDHPFGRSTFRDEGLEHRQAVTL
jgi:hypothetical protein